MISCSCDYDGGICAVGVPRQVTCRTSRECSCCDSAIVAGDGMYIQSFYDFDEYKAYRPSYLCDECGEHVLNLVDLGYCFGYDQGIREQWLEYLRKSDPANPAVCRKKTLEELSSAGDFDVMCANALGARKVMAHGSRWHVLPQGGFMEVNRD